ncbi:2-polyprenyl-6-methoxyphenol hydroxylase [Chryseobacterium taichungense]|uniref:Flavin-dependent monooxygenase n=1 Tax=Chryseobacterium taichungense TaxID=295069 RepID=A0A1H8CH59_9FLAO|nr:NAD(P)/FAD-dependent oxidoreductase [Chryseobacterium taichungense]SEM93417.1 2-polyprenyl-6-methoxyphenol hydroxylase [Chryseobacterium taichungense]
MLLENKSVAIIGGGPGGLTLAKLLQQKNINVKVYERDFDENARVQGSPLDLHYDSGLAALREANLLDEFKKNFLPGADREKIMNEKAEIFFSDHGHKLEEDFNNIYFRPEIDRGVLRKILLQSLEPETVIWNSHFLSMESQNAGWLLHFKDQPSVYADLVIGADGANSKIRPYVTEIRPFYTGIMMLEGNIPNASQTAPGINALLEGGKIMAFGNNQNLLMGQKANWEIGFYASFRAPEDWKTQNGIIHYNNDEVFRWFKDSYGDWSNIWDELFIATVPPFIPRPIYCIPLDQYWESQSNVTIIGDAAHVMPPFAGEGVNMAMLDALELSRNLLSDNFTDILQAIIGYEESMRKRASLIAGESLANGEFMHSENALQSMVKMFERH